ncbi:hypothetical protein HDU90_005230 [Geranomyces variabilis]|nr:hypothetical protein HDU90_005230 [Geranomyces variabilis]
MKHMEARLADPLKRASRFTSLRVAVAQAFISSVALREGYQHRDEATIIAQAEAVMANGEGKENAQVWERNASWLLSASAGAAIARHTHLGGLCAGAVNLRLERQRLERPPVVHITGTIDVQFLKGETIVDPNVVVKTRIPFEEERFAALGPWIFIMFAIRDMFAVPWAEIDQASAIINDQEAGTTSISRFFKTVVRECRLNSEAISLKSNRKGVARAAKQFLPQDDIQGLLNHRAGTATTKTHYQGKDVTHIDIGAVHSVKPTLFWAQAWTHRTTCAAG